ncbi:MAG TPA: hypothetical protein PLU67_07925 [Candidatus Kapabacteria bacterium]|nr:hypothetical protein [Candidatus Kapabacteria bacterium]HPP39477.1 hypothetical protein [Candidatus Kapabacteria bacterium]
MPTLVDVMMLIVTSLSLIFFIRYENKKITGRIIENHIKQQKDFDEVSGRIVVLEERIQFVENLLERDKRTTEKDIDTIKRMLEAIYERFNRHIEQS